MVEQSWIEPVNGSSRIRWFVSNSSCVRWCGGALSCPPRPACDCVGGTVGSDPRSRSAPPHPRSHDSCPWSETFSSMMELVSTFHPHPRKDTNPFFFFFSSNRLSVPNTNKFPNSRSKTARACCGLWLGICSARAMLLASKLSSKAIRAP